MDPIGNVRYLSFLPNPVGNSNWLPNFKKVLPFLELRRKEKAVAHHPFAVGTFLPENVLQRAELLREAWTPIMGSGTELV